VLHTLEREGWRGDLKLCFAKRFGRSILERREHAGPLLVQRALYPEGPSVCHLVLVHPPGGLAATDVLCVEATLARGAHALLTTPGATKWYRSSAGDAAENSMRVALEGNSVLEWLPRENIVFDAARVKSRLCVSLSAEARFLGWEILCFGRRAAGERFVRGHVDLATRITRAGRPLWLERASVDPGSGFMESAVGLSGYSVSGTFLVAGCVIDDGLLRACRKLSIGNEECRFGITSVPALLIARYLGHSAEDAFNWFASLWCVLRPRVLGIAPALPRIWAC
jgi:urease accessory protein